MSLTIQQLTLLLNRYYEGATYNARIIHAWAKKARVTVLAKLRALRQCVQCENGFEDGQSMRPDTQPPPRAAHSTTRRIPLHRETQDHDRHPTEFHSRRGRRTGNIKTRTRVGGTGPTEGSKPKEGRRPRGRSRTYQIRLKQAGPSNTDATWAHGQIKSKYETAVSSTTVDSSSAKQ
ncbi:hypothetical protein R1sor_018055 [Riccia sorocarpa]|uniref:Uncharacterized protein n=1 Tax=Riccia sorocarpa TaxID=122646 RepID=A0ABD3I8L3_9MARC